MRSSFVLILAVIGSTSGCTCSWRKPAAPAPEVRIFVETRLPSLESEKALALPLERALAGEAGLEQMQSTCAPGGVEVRMRFERSRDPAQARVSALERLRGVTGLPAEAAPQVEPDVGRVIFRYTIESKDRSATELRVLADWVVRPGLLTVPGVAEVTTCGGRVRRIEVVVDPARLAAMGLSLHQVAGAIESAGTKAGMATRLPDLASLSVGEQAGVPILVKDVAVVREGAAPSECWASRDGLDVVAGEVWARRGEQEELVLKAVRSQIEHLAASVSPGTELRPFDDGTGEEHLTLRLRTSLPPGLSLVTQRTYATAVRSALLTIPEVNSVRVRIGRRLSPRLPAPFEMELLLVLKSQQQWRSSTHTDALIDEILKGLASTPGLGPGFDLADASRPESRDLARWRPVGERIQGDDLQQLNRHAMQSFSAAGQTPGVHATRLIPVVGDEPRVDISPDAEALAAHGLTLQALAEHLEVAREGRVVASLVEGGRRVEVVLLAAEPESEGPLSVVRVPMVVPGGTLQLAEVAKVELRPSPAVIERSGSHRSVQLRIAAPGTDAAALIERLKADREKSQLPPGFVITWEPVLDD